MSWPPSLSSAQEANLLTLASDFALTHGLVYRPPPPPPESGSKPSTTTCIHAPYSLFPQPFPRDLFVQAQRLQPLYNALYAHVTVDDQALDRIVGAQVAQVDPFQKQLYDMYRLVRQEPIKQPLHLGLFRSDYLLHLPAGQTAAQPTIKQVEFNTISASFGCLSSKVTDLHSYLLQTGSYPSDPRLRSEALPANPSLQGLATGLAQGHQAYGNPNARILMVTQDDERNAFDQRPLEYELLRTHHIHLLRIPFSELHLYSSLDPKTSNLILTLPSHPETPFEISVIYYRSGYSPEDYTTQGKEWETRLLFERSRAIKCPTLALQLSGCKKVQQVLADPKELARFLDIGSAPTTTTKEEVVSKLHASSSEHEALVSSFMNLYPLDSTPEGERAYQLALSSPSRFVLKPQREGGGNNIYRTDIPPFLAQLEAKDKELGSKVKAREAYILMELIEPPLETRSIMVRAGEEKGVQGEVVSELGIYGICLFGKNEGPEGGAHVRINQTVGQLLRTKGRESDEGGVAVGFSVIDSVLLV
ncbi:glutathione synthetase [Microbotryum lychnidis-dioicae p1A1 Lamole]|uniref:Glutathione synthetase n=2 Tax=Microbotryum TaxID=34416 RepID=U5HAE2_USTV1|nr:glutathione synthetase [Microbotryum lychnidis-dioicae p1A1 Lamole]SGY19022.1 BQ5605_C014g07539 [Microbotryum silenes-dioicae]|eukprot:KDE05484.1 glutathione synthetase [Microbotryum lychnidis-dioicae p1A1 Lamole]